MAHVEIEIVADFVGRRRDFWFAADGMKKKIDEGAGEPEGVWRCNYHQVDICVGGAIGHGQGAGDENGLDTGDTL